MFTLHNRGNTEELVNAIATKATEQGLTLSRWQTNKRGHQVTIIYALHTGERAYQFRHQAEETVVAYIHLHNLEGATTRSDAYKQLSRLAKVVNL